MTIAFYAAVAMVFQDILAVIMCQLENRRRGWGAGIFDALQYLCGIVTAHYALNSLNGHKGQVWVFTLVTIANIGGSKLGVTMGDKWFPDNRLGKLESWAIQKGYVK